MTTQKKETVFTAIELVFEDNGEKFQITGDVLPTVINTRSSNKAFDDFSRKKWYEVSFRNSKSG